MAEVHYVIISHIECIASIIKYCLIINRMIDNNIVLMQRRFLSIELVIFLCTSECCVFLVAEADQQVEQPSHLHGDVKMKSMFMLIQSLLGQSVIIEPNIIVIVLLAMIFKLCVIVF